MPSAAKRTVTTPPGSICVITPSPSVLCRTLSPVESDGTLLRGATWLCFGEP